MFCYMPIPKRRPNLRFLHALILSIGGSCHQPGRCSPECDDRINRDTVARSRYGHTVIRLWQDRHP